MPILDPYAGVDWSRPGLRGNLHVHSTQSDGQATPQKTLDAYAYRGHGFAMLSDHDRWTSAEELAALDARGMVLLPGQEVSRDGGHILQVGGTAAVAPDQDRQHVLDAIAAVGGLAVMNHPNWLHDHEKEHWPLAGLLALRGYAGIEVVNAVIDELEGDRCAFNRWDRLLGHGRRIWGFANDDAHALHHVGQAWNVVHPLAPGTAGVVAALAAGRFFASTGLEVGRILVDGDSVEVSCPDAECIIATTDWGRRVGMIDGTRLRAHLPAGSTYLRFACLGRGERAAWTQPFFRA
jgi:hypothetical protein